MTDTRKTVNKAQLSNGEIRYYEDTFARENIEIINNEITTISADLDSKQDVLTAGSGLEIYKDSEGNTIISNTQTSAEWGNITGHIEDQHDLVEYINENGGKIDTISVNNVTQPIENKNVNIIVPTKTSELVNDSEFTSLNQVSELLETKQDVLTPGSGIDISTDSEGHTVISSTGGDANIIAGNGIVITDTSEGSVISLDSLILDCGTSTINV